LHLFQNKKILRIIAKTNKSSVEISQLIFKPIEKINSRMTFNMMTILKERALNVGKVEIEGGKKVI